MPWSLVGSRFVEGLRGGVELVEFVEVLDAVEVEGSCCRSGNGSSPERAPQLNPQRAVTIEIPRSAGKRTPATMGTSLARTSSFSVAHPLHWSRVSAAAFARW